MYTYAACTNRDVFSSTKVEYALPIQGLLRFAVPIKTSCSLNYIELKFNTQETTCKGSLKIAVKHGNTASTFVIPIANIQDSTPYQFALESHPVFTDTIDIAIIPDYTEGYLSLCANKSFPYLVVNGSVLNTYKITDRPNIVLVTPVYRPKLAYFKEAVKSVLEQVYDNWYWVIVDDGSVDVDLSIYLAELAKDPRIHVIQTSSNTGISSALNTGLDTAKNIYKDNPYYVALLDHDDTLHPEALLEVASAIDEDKSRVVLYTDEDKVDDRGQYSSPYYKPDWSYHMFLSQMYTCHLTVYAATLIDRVGIFKTEYDGAQDYDYMLRCVEQLNAEERIHHISKVLYHWRKHAGSAAGNLGAKPEASMRAVQAIKSHLDRVFASGDSVTRGAFPGTYRVYKRPTNSVPVRIIIPTYDKYEYLKACLFSISQTKAAIYRSQEVIVVTNNRDETEIERILQQGHPHAGYTLIKTPIDEFNYSNMLNFAVSYAGKFPDGEDGYYLFLNDDIEALSVDWLEEMTNLLDQPDVGVVGAKLLYPDMRIQHAGVVIGIGGIAGHSHKYLPDGQPGYFSRPHLVQDVSAVTGACLLTKASVFENVGGFEAALPRAFNDVDYCLKVRAVGKKVLYTPHARLIHHESVSRGLDTSKDPTFRQAVHYMETKWKCSTYKDPFYSPHLSLVHEDFSMRR